MKNPIVPFIITLFIVAVLLGLVYIAEKTNTWYIGTMNRQAARVFIGWQDEGEHRAWLVTDDKGRAHIEVER